MLLCFDLQPASYIYVYSALSVLSILAYFVAQLRGSKTKISIRGLVGDLRSLIGSRTSRSSLAQALLAGTRDVETAPEGCGLSMAKSRDSNHRSQQTTTKQQPNNKQITTNCDLEHA
jgi:hypothetical protein